MLVNGRFMIVLLICDLHSAAITISGLKMTVSKFKRGQNTRVITVAYKSEMSSLKNNSFPSHRSVPKLA